MSALLLPSAACSVFAHAKVNIVGGYRFEVFHADRFTSVSYDRIEIGFRVYEDGDDLARVPFDEAFDGRMQVVDDAGHAFPVIVRPMKWAATSEHVLVRGYLGIVKLGGRNTPSAAYRSRTSGS